VLPFANMSGGSTQEYLTDGITEELTTALARCGCCVWQRPPILATLRPSPFWLCAGRRNN